MNTIRSRLLLWLIGGVAASLIVAGVATYAEVHEEVVELTDYQLRNIAEALPPNIPTQSVSAMGGPEELIVVQLYDTKGQLIYGSHPEFVLQRYDGEGLLTVVAHGHQWRVFRDHRHGRFVQVAQSLESRDAMAFEIAMRSLLPFALLLPLLGVLVWGVVWRAMRPLRDFAKVLDERSEHALTPIESAGMSADLQPMVGALNDLLGRLQRALGAQQAFIGNAAHELRSPLMALKLQLQLFERARSPEKRAAALAKLHQGLDRATRLVSQLLNLARYERPLQAGDLEKVDLRELAESVVAELAALAEGKSIDLGVVDNGERCTVTTERESLRIMLLNLVDNAVRYSPEGERVDLIVTRDHMAGVALRIVDSGQGIESSERALVFSRFYRGAGNKEIGSGLGLSIVRSIAERIGATVLLEDNPLGAGLMVTVLLPGRTMRSVLDRVDRGADTRPGQGPGTRFKAERFQTK